MKLLRSEMPVAAFPARFDCVHNHVHGHATHRLQGLADGSQSRRRERRERYIIKTNHGALLGNADPCLGSARMAPRAVKSSNASNALNLFLLCSNSSVKR